jgi:hypothetical protein
MKLTQACLGKVDSSLLVLVQACSNFRNLMNRLLENERTLSRALSPAQSDRLSLAPQYSRRPQRQRHTPPSPKTPAPSNECIYRIGQPMRLSVWPAKIPNKFNACNRAGTLPLSAIDTACGEPPSSGMRVDAREFGGTITSTAQNIRFVVSLRTPTLWREKQMQIVLSCRDNHKEDVQTSHL